MAKWRNASLPTRLARVPIRVLFVRPVPWGFGSSGKEGEAAMRGMRSIPCHMYCMIWISSSDESKNNTADKTLYFSFFPAPFSLYLQVGYMQETGELGDLVTNTADIFLRARKTSCSTFFVRQNSRCLSSQHFSFSAS